MTTIRTMRIFLYIWILITIAVISQDCGLGGLYYTVKKGDTLYSLSKRYKVDLIELTMINRINDPSKIKVGQVLYIPEVGGRDDGERVYPKKSTRASPSKKKSSFKSKKTNFIWPLKGKVSSYFGIRGDRRHLGIDIRASSGSPFVAADSGRVIFSGDKLKGYGNLIIIKHSGNYATVYAHNKKNLVKDGDFVKKGQVIGKVGQTGRASGPHLHFEVRVKNIARNPIQFLP